MTLKYGSEWTISSTTFKKHFSTFEKTIMWLISAIVADMENRFISGVRIICCEMDELVSKQQRFHYNLSTLYATNVKFHLSNRSHRNHWESETYFSSKQHLYRYKIEAFVSPNGFDIFVSSHYPGTKSDLAICRDLADNHPKFTAKSLKDEEIVDEDKDSLSWGVMFLTKAIFA